MSTLRGTVVKILRSQDRKAGIAEHEWLDALKVSPSCPPSKAMHVRGGRSYLGNSYYTGWDDYEERAYTIPDLVADLDDVESVVTDILFTTAGAYQFFLLEMCLPAVIEEPTASDWTFYLHGTGDEFDTAAEAEAWLDSETFQNSEAWDHGSDGICYPLCGLVLKNDGNVGLGRSILPIDAVNRGRSYMWPRDMRPLQFMAG